MLGNCWALEAVYLKRSFVLIFYARGEPTGAKLFYKMKNLKAY